MLPPPCVALEPEFILLRPWPVPVPAASGAQRAQQVAPDDVALNLGGPVPDALDACIAPESRKGKVTCQPHAAVNLDRLVGDPREHLRGVEFLRRQSRGRPRDPDRAATRQTVSASPPHRFP